MLLSDFIMIEDQQARFPCSFSSQLFYVPWVLSISGPIPSSSLPAFLVLHLWASIQGSMEVRLFDLRDLTHHQAHPLQVLISWIQFYFCILSKVDALATLWQEVRIPIYHLDLYSPWGVSTFFLLPLFSPALSQGYIMLLKTLSEHCNLLHNTNISLKFLVWLQQLVNSCVKGTSVLMILSTNHYGGNYLAVIS